MAGAGYKLFNTGDVLTAAQVNTYLMQQTVMVFASSAARTSALSGVLAEGMVSYLQDTNTLEVYDGSAWVGATGDITGLTAGTGISISSATGPVPTITSDVATTFDAKGDLVVGTGADTFAKLTVGNSGDTIVADSSTSTGLRWQGSIAAGKNAVINGGFDVWQRGTSGTSRGYNSADRWFCNNPGVGGRTFSRQTSDLAGFQYFMRMQRTAGNTATDGFSITYNAETADSMRFAGKTVTLSWWMRKGANYSGGGVRGGLYSGTGTDQNLDNAYTGTATVVSLSGTPTTSWVRYSVTGTVSSSATELAFTFVWDPTGTAGAADYLDITGFQLEVGSVPTEFSRAGGTLAGEFQACQRYYQTNYPVGTAPGSDLSGSINGTNSAFILGINAFCVVGGTVGTSRNRVTFIPTVIFRSSPTMRLWDSLGNLNRYNASDENGTFISNNNAFDAFGGTFVAGPQRIGFQTVAAANTHDFASVMWDASAEL